MPGRQERQSIAKKKIPTQHTRPKQTPASAFKQRPNVYRPISKVLRPQRPHDRRSEKPDLKNAGRRKLPERKNLFKAPRKNAGSGKGGPDGGSGSSPGTPDQGAGQGAPGDGGAGDGGGDGDGGGGGDGGGMPGGGMPPGGGGGGAGAGRRPAGARPSAPKPAPAAPAADKEGAPGEEENKESEDNADEADKADSKTSDEDKKAKDDSTTATYAPKSRQARVAAAQAKFDSYVRKAAQAGVDYFSSWWKNAAAAAARESVIRPVWASTLSVRLKKAADQKKASSRTAMVLVNGLRKVRSEQRYVNEDGVPTIKRETVFTDKAGQKVKKICLVREPNRERQTTTWYQDGKRDRARVVAVERGGKKLIYHLTFATSPSWHRTASSLSAAR
jgi:hypothetical protein